jgi:hypothetical protein
MPRQSADARAAAKWRADPKYPEPPPGMDARACKLWREVVESRPRDFFRSGSLSLLRTFCQTSVVLEDIGPQMVADPADKALSDRFVKLALLQSNLAARLRLAVQVSMRIENARTQERAGQRRAEAEHLLGGKRVWETD